MLEVSPLRGPGDDPWLLGLAAAELDLWLARGRAAEIDEALIRLAGRGGPDSWRVEVRGGRGAARYVAEVAGTGRAGDGAGLTVAAAATDAALDAAATTGSGLLLVQPATGRPRLGLVRDPAGRWAVLAVRAGLDPRGMLVAAWSDDATAPPAAPVRRRAGWRIAAMAGVTAAAVAVAAVTGTPVLRRHDAAAPSPLAPPIRGAAQRALANPGLIPAAPPGSAVAFDRHHGVGLLLRTGSGGEETWTWGGQYWSQARPDASPGPRSFPAVAFDPRQGDVVLVGGTPAAATPGADTWTWDGTTWTRVAGAAPQPAPAAFPLLAEAPPSDPAGDGLLLLDAGTTWSWSGQGWRQRGTGGPLPLPGTAAMALDSASRTELLVGAAAGEPGAATWQWTPSGWTELQPAHRPPAGAAAAMATDPATGHVVLVLGAGPAAGPRAQTWTWDGADWSLRQPGGPGAMPVGLLADSVAGTVVAVVGDRGGEAPLQTLTWTGATWVPIASALDAGYDGPEPSPRNYAGSAADPRTGAVLLVGGQQFGEDAPINPLGDVWSWSGSAWTPQPPGPSARASPLMAPDPGGGVLLVGGFDPLHDTTWPDAWRWAGGSWTRLPWPLGRTPGFIAAGLATDQRLGTAVLLGACCPGNPGAARAGLQTWTWDGAAWTQRRPAHSPPNSGLLVDDPARGRVLALVEPPPSAATPDPSGARSLALDTWAWDGSDWHDLGQQVLGPVRGAAPDPVTGDVVVVGDPVWGSGGTQLFDGRSWLRRPLPNAPDTVVAGAPMVVDPRLDRLVVLSGPAGQLSEEWMWTGLAWIQLDLSAPGVP